MQRTEACDLKQTLEVLNLEIQNLINSRRSQVCKTAAVHNALSLRPERHKTLQRH